MIYQIFGLVYIIAGLILFFGTEQFYHLLGYIYGPYSDHFIKDGGLAFISSGILLSFPIVDKIRKASFIIAGLIFLNLHSFFHIWMILRHSHQFSIVLELILNIIPPTILSLLMIRGKEYKL